MSDNPGYGPRFVETMANRDKMRAAITAILADATPEAQQEIGRLAAALYSYGFTGSTCSLQVADNRVVNVIYAGYGKYLAHVVTLTDARNP